MKKETLTVETDEHGTVTYRNDEGELHNPDGPAMVRADGYKAYLINGNLHNSHGPAIVDADGSKAYYINDHRHNPNGPAVVFADGRKAYYINGKLLTEAEFKTWQAEQSAPLHNKTVTIDGIKYTLTAK
tara:strand:- start:42 stop:428 length:387 start_codon:yes stop_codon:yes gene_type:complete